jgi:hypothetical protein
MYMKEKIRFKKIAKMTVAENNYSYGYQLYPSEYIYSKNILSVPSGGGTGLLMLSFSWKEAEINQGIIINFKSYF